jgi:hypothetical protein
MIIEAHCLNSFWLVAQVHVSEGEEGSNGSGEPSCVPVEPYGFIFDCDDRDPTQVWK